MNRVEFPRQAVADTAHIARRSGLLAEPTNHEAIRRCREQLRVVLAPHNVVLGHGCTSARNPFATLYHLDDNDEDILRDAALALTATFGRPFPVVTNWPLWHSIPVDENRPPDRFGGIGLNPVHMDMVNTSAPPVVISFLCLQPDPAGGGKTLLVRIPNVLLALDSDDRRILETTEITEGDFYNLEGVGESLPTFPILSLGRSPELRFTAKWRSEVDRLTQSQRATYDRLSSTVESLTQSVSLATGDLLVFGNRSYLHGRQALGSKQELIPLDRRRKVLQLYCIECHECST